MSKPKRIRDHSRRYVGGRDSHRSVTRYTAGGRRLTKEQQVEIFWKLFPDREALIRLWPGLTEKTIRKRSYLWKAKTGERREEWTEADLVLFRELYPDLDLVRKAFPHRSNAAIYNRACRLGLKGPRSDRRWSEAEDLALQRGQIPEGRNYQHCSNRAALLGFKFRRARDVRKIEGRELLDLLNGIVPRTLPRQVRDEVLADLAMACLEGRLATEPGPIAAAVRSTVTAVYKRHPDKGAPVSLDMPAFEDGTTTVGDTMSSDVFRF